MKIAARLANFKGCFGLIWHLTLPSPATLPEPALWARYEFLNEHTTKIHFRGDSCVNQCGFNLESTLIENISAFLIQPSGAVFSPSWITYDTCDTTGIRDVILKPMQSDLVCGK